MPCAAFRANVPAGRLLVGRNDRPGQLVVLKPLVLRRSRLDLNLGVQEALEESPSADPAFRGLLALFLLDADGDAAVLLWLQPGLAPLQGLRKRRRLTEQRQALSAFSGDPKT